jgi:hypothetical protein
MTPVNFSSIDAAWVIRPYGQFSSSFIKESSACAQYDDKGFAILRRSGVDRVRPHSGPGQIDEIWSEPDLCVGRLGQA